MRAKTLQIIWHEKQPVFSVDFHPDGYLATGGADREIKIWELSCDDDGWPQARYLTRLAAHSKTVNCVRFSPAGDCLASAGDGGEVVVWRPAPPGSAPQRAFGEAPPLPGPDGAADGGGCADAPNAPTWRMVGNLKGHHDDVMDVAWAPDGAALMSGCVENEVLVFDMEARRSVARLAGHRHYVQGVAWDPLGRYVVSLSADRTCRVHAAKAAAGAGSKKAQQQLQGGPAPSNITARDLALLCSLSKRSMPPAAATATPAAPAPAAAAPAAAAGVPTTACSSAEVDGGGAAATSGAQDVASAPVAPVAPAAPQSHPLFQDESLSTFFRRMSWSPEGSLLALPAGLFRGSGDAPAALSTYLYARGEWTAPLAHLPAPGKAPVVARFCPALFKIRPGGGGGGGAGDDGDGDSGGGGCGGSDAEGAATPLGLPYRMILAVATLDSVVLYDTQTLSPVLVLGPLHYAAITDLAWSQDGAFLVVSSNDGYCSAAHFGEGELGERLPRDQLPPGLAAAEARAAKAAEGVAGAGAAAGGPAVAAQVARAPAAGGEARQEVYGGAAPTVAAAAGAAAGVAKRRITPQPVAAAAPVAQQQQQQQQQASGPHGRRITPQPAGAPPACAQAPAAVAAAPGAQLDAPSAARPAPARRIAPTQVGASAPAAAAGAQPAPAAAAAAAAPASAAGTAGAGAAPASEGAAPRRIPPQRAAAAAAAAAADPSNASAGSGGGGGGVGGSIAMLAASMGRAAALKRKQQPAGAAPADPAAGGAGAGSGAGFAKKSRPDGHTDG